MASKSRRRGSALIEFGLTAPLLLLLLGGVLDFAMLLRTAASVADAARAGAQYGSASPVKASDSAGIRAAAIAAAPGVTGLTASSTQACSCYGGGSVACNGSCPSGMLMYVQVTAQATAPAIFSYPAVNFSGTVSCTAKMRAR